MVRKVCLCSLVIFALFISINIAVGIDVAICTVAHPMPQSDADEEIAVLKDAIQEAVNLQLFGADDLDALADWVQEHTSGENHILILTGISPTTLYPAGNAKPDGSIVE